MARPKLGETDTERMQLKITSAEVEAIDDWRFENRIPSRSEAVRRLVQLGLVADKAAPELHRYIRKLMDEDFIAFELIGKDTTSEEERGKVLKQLSRSPDRIKMLLKSLSIYRAVDAFRTGKSFDDSLSINKMSELDLLSELQHQLSFLNEGETE